MTDSEAIAAYLGIIDRMKEALVESPDAKFDAYWNVAMMKWAIRRREGKKDRDFMYLLDGNATKMREVLGCGSVNDLIAMAQHAATQLTIVPAIEGADW